MGFKVDRLKILFRDKTYQKNFVDYLRENYKNFEVLEIESLEKLKKHIDLNLTNEDVIIIDYDLHQEIKNNEEVILDFIVVLSETEHSDLKESVYKFQEVDKIMKLIRSKCLDKKRYIKGKFGKKTEVVCVYSPAGGVGKSTISLSCCNYCVKNEKKALLLNFEGVDTLEELFGYKGYKGLSELSYYVKSKKDKLDNILLDFVIQDEMTSIEYIPPVSNVRDMYELQPEEVVYLISKYKELNLYDYIFIDMSSVLNCTNLELLNYAETILLVFNQDYNSLSKARNFIKQMGLIDQTNDEEVLRKAQIVINSYKTNLKTQIEFLNLNPYKKTVKVPNHSGLVSNKDARTVINFELISSGIEDVMRNL